MSDPVANLAARLNALEGMVRGLNAKNMELMSQVQAQSRQGRRDSDPLPKMFLAKEGSSAKQFAEQTVSSGTMGAYTDGRTCTSDSDPSALIADGDDVLVVELPDVVSSVPTSRYVRVPIGMFPVTVTEDGGADATSNTTYATWTYTVTSLAGNTLGTGMSPTKPRNMGSLNAGTGPATGYYSGTTFVLYDAGETDNYEAGCT